MGNMRIIEIPASMRESALRKNTVRKLRVAAYCRVSTEEEEQQGSFEIQKLYYTEKINSTPEWEVAGIYADDGISGVHTKKRDGFNQMIQDCKKHRIDLILTKSISRFARNTLDSIQYVRMLKQMGIAVVFEKENINTATMNSEMILTVLSAFAQAESESISQNVARGKRMGYKHGKFAFPYGRIIGYRKGADGKPEMDVPEEITPLCWLPFFQMTACRLTDDLDRWNKHPLQRAMEKFVSSKSANYVNSPFSEDTPGRA